MRRELGPRTPGAPEPKSRVKPVSPSGAFPPVSGLFRIRSPRSLGPPSCFFSALLRRTSRRKNGTGSVERPRRSDSEETGNGSSFFRRSSVEQLQLELAEPNLGRVAGVELERDHAAVGAEFVETVDALLAIDPGLDAVALDLDLVAVPVVLLDVLLAGAVREDAAAVLLVELAPPARADVGLVAGDIAVRDRSRSKLDAGVARVALELDLEGQAEIAKLELADEEL